MAEQGTAERLIEVATAEVGTVKVLKITKPSMANLPKQISNLGVVHLLTGVVMKQE